MGSDCEQSINDHDHLEMVVGTKARFGGCAGQTEAWDMTKGVPLALTLMNYEQTNFVSEWSRGDRAGVSKSQIWGSVCYTPLRKRLATHLST